MEKRMTGPAPEDHLDWFRKHLNNPEAGKPMQNTEKLSLRRWRYDIPRLAATHLPPSAFTATGSKTATSDKNDDEDLRDMGFSRIYGRYRLRTLDYEDLCRGSRNRWNPPEEREEYKRRAADYKRQIEYLEHLMRQLHFQEWMQQLQREEHERQQRLERSRCRSRSRGFDMSR